jgi:hypothetical protein
MKKHEFKSKLLQIEAIFNKTNVTLDDGRDDHDPIANHKFSSGMTDLENIRKDLSFLELDGINMDNIWNANPHSDLHLPENLSNNISWLIEEYKKLC